MNRWIDTLSERFFRLIHGRHLIYNACWEDPEIDRRLLGITPESRLVVITSAGCNALDYLLDRPAEIHAVDVNPRQNALLELKCALIERGDYNDFFQMFGKGWHCDYRGIYADVRSQISLYAQKFWDRRINIFDRDKGLRRSFYYHGTSGFLAWLMRTYLFRVKKKAGICISRMMTAGSLEEQQLLYRDMEGLLWNRFNSWLLKRPAVMSLAGVPKAQLRLIEERYPGGFNFYIKDKLRHVFTQVPLWTNYFWRVYLTGTYSPSCCPNYLKADNFRRLRRQTHKIRTHNTSLSGFLEQKGGPYTHYILLDHQDWMAGHEPEELKNEWELILKNSRPGTRILFRSAGIDRSFLPPLAESALRFRPELSEPLHRQDRVGTYGSLHFAEVLG
jgi:S-adenosylmethionine-diacylglycerol 3-amino-3-carboxypropyl transferase